VGYGRVASLFGHRLQLAGGVGIAAEMDTRDFRARLQVLTSIVRWRSLYLTGSTALIARGTDNSIYRGYNFGTDLTGALGVYRSGWFFAAQFGLDKAVITHVTHSDWYRTYSYLKRRTDGIAIPAALSTMGRPPVSLSVGRSCSRGMVCYGLKS
jgi:hypothetical protein